MTSRCLLSLCAAAVLAACQSAPPKDPRADWRIEPLLRVTNAGATAQAWYTLGRYYQGQNRSELALRAYRQTLAIDPRHAEAHNAIGAISALHGDLDLAIQAFEAALANAPAAAHVLSNLANCSRAPARPQHGSRISDPLLRKRR